MDELEVQPPVMRKTLSKKSTTGTDEGGQKWCRGKIKFKSDVSGK